MRNLNHHSFLESGFAHLVIEKKATNTIRKDVSVAFPLLLPQ
ncbi:hypothetical protein [Desulfitobacterium hafniense]|nr:hypothetical protein [Desulfitobacterium hafniense]